MKHHICKVFLKSTYYCGLQNAMLPINSVKKECWRGREAKALKHYCFVLLFFSYKDSKWSAATNLGSTGKNSHIESELLCCQACLQCVDVVTGKGNPHMHGWNSQISRVFFLLVSREKCSWVTVTD